MNTLFFCQSDRIDLFYNCSKKILDQKESSKFGFFVTDSRVFNTFVDKNDVKEDFFLKEWEIIQEAQKTKVDLELISRYEKKLGNPFLWNSIVCDRRVYHGKNYSFTQDYKPRYSYNEMMAILQVSLIRIEDLIKKIKPKCIVTFQCVTLCEYLSYLFAKKNKIVFLNLRPTRIDNYIYAGESIYEPSNDIEISYNKIMNSKKESIDNSSQKYLNQVKNKNAMYEGVIPPTKKSPISETHQKKIFRSLLSLNKIRKLVQDELSYRFGKLRYDNQVSGPINTIINQYIFRPIRVNNINRFLKSKYVNAQDLRNINYVFFPLHTEPEVTLLVYSKPYMNQLEAIRLISHNLPVGMKLIVKEHPWNIGKRKLGYFKKLLQIPNVMIASPDLESRQLINYAKLISVISGSIAMEALILKKPAIVLGMAPFNFLSKSMIRHISNPNTISDEIKDLLTNYNYNENSIRSYVQAVIEKSVAVDFYSVLMNRKEAINAQKNESDIKNKKPGRAIQIETLSNYLLKRYNELKSNII